MTFPARENFLSLLPHALIDFPLSSLRLRQNDKMLSAAVSLVTSTTNLVSAMAPTLPTRNRKRKRSSTPPTPKTPLSYVEQLYVPPIQSRIITTAYTTVQDLLFQLAPPPRPSPLNPSQILGFIHPPPN